MIHAVFTCEICGTELSLKARSPREAAEIWELLDHQQTHPEPDGLKLATAEYKAEGPDCGGILTVKGKGFTERYLIKQTEESGQPDYSLNQD